MDRCMYVHVSFCECGWCMCDACVRVTVCGVYLCACMRTFVRACVCVVSLCACVCTHACICASTCSMQRVSVSACQRVSVSACQWQYSRVTRGRTTHRRHHGCPACSPSSPWRMRRTRHRCPLPPHGLLTRHVIRQPSDTNWTKTRTSLTHSGQLVIVQTTVQ